MTTTGPEMPTAEPSWDQPGGLGIKEKRSWQTWQFIAAIVVAALIGMAIGHSGGGSSGAAGGGGTTSRTLPPDNVTATTLAGASGASGASGPDTTIGSGDTTATTTAGASGASGATGATGASGSTGGAPTTTAPAGPQTYLIHNQQGTGPSNLPAFTIAGGDWSIGWAYRCVLAPNGAAKFQIAAGTKNAVDEQGREGSGTTPQSTAGPQNLKIVTDPACAWAVTVVGVAG